MSTTSAVTCWSLQDLLPAPDSPQLTDYLRRLEEGVKAIEAARPMLTPDIPTGEFLELLGLVESVNAIGSRLGAYAALWFAENTQNPAALNLQSRLDQILADASNRVLFLDLWIKEMPQETADRLIAASGDRHYWIESLRRFRTHTLPERQEQIITLKDVNGINAVVNLYEMITNKFSFTLKVDGEEKTLTRDQLAAYFRSPSPEVRAAAYQELYRVYGDNSTILGQIYNHRVRDWDTEALQLRSYTSPIAVRDLANDIPDPVVETLLGVCRQNVTIFQRYFRLKAKWLGVDRLRRYDLYAPLVPAEKEVSFPEAMQMVFDAYRDFSPEMAAQAQRVPNDCHLDADPRPGKRGGAFCYTVLPQLTPWVLTNFTGRARDVSTLAHELGHAVHSMMASKHSLLTFHAPLPLAETASVFGEMLLMDRMLKLEKDPAVRRDLLANSLDDAYATVQRQAFFTIFERDAHAMIGEGKSIDELAAHYLGNLAEQFGDSIVVSDDFKWEWVAIPHIYFAPFYTYAYSFGQLLVLALYQRYLAEGESFVPKYFKILSYGGSEAPARILAEAGIDMASPTFWQGGFDVLQGRIDELEKLA